MKNRREFIHQCAAVGATLLVPGSALAAAGPAVGAKLSKSSFQPLMHQVFRCFTGRGHALRLELVEVRDGPVWPGLEQFGLVLRDTGGVRTSLPPDLYRLHHPSMGRVLMHLAPADSSPGRYVTQFGLFT